MNNYQNNDSGSQPTGWCDSFIISLLIWVISIGIIGIILLAATGDMNLPVKERVLNAVKFNIDALKSGYVSAITDKLDDQAGIAASLDHEKELHTQYKKLNSFLSGIDTAAKARDVMTYEGDLNNVLNNYRKSCLRLEEMKSGAKFEDNIVLDTVKQLTEINENISKTYSDNPNPPAALNAAENSKTLGKILLQAGYGFEYQIDSYGFTAIDNNGGTVVINGYWKYDPANINFDIEKLIKIFHFSNERRSAHNISIQIIKDYGIKTEYWGFKKMFDIPALGAELGFRKTPYGTFNGVYASVHFSQDISFTLPCKRVFLHTVDGMEVIVLDLRKQDWCQWSTGSYIPKDAVSCVRQFLPQIFNPGIADLRSTGKISCEHVQISDVVRSNMAEKFLNGQKPATLIPPWEQLVNLNSGTPKTNTPETTSPKTLTADDHITNGSDWEIQKEYKKAYESYAKAAEMGSDTGKYNCIVLLFNQQVTHSRGLFNTDHSYTRILELADEIFKESKNEKILGETACIVGYVYQNGGFGVSKNLQKAREYFNLGIRYGNSNASDALADLNRSFRR